MDATKEEVLEAFETFNKDTDKLNVFLGNIDKIRRFWFNDKLLDLYPVEEIIQHAFNRLMTLDRKWNKSSRPKFDNILYLVCKSIIRNTVETNKKFKPNTNEKKIVTSLDEVENYEFIQKELSVDFIDPFNNEIINECNNLLKDETEQLVFMCRYDGMNNKETAEELNINIKDVENAMKRIKRTLRPFLEKNNILKKRSDKILTD